MITTLVFLAQGNIMIKSQGIFSLSPDNTVHPTADTTWIQYWIQKASDRLALQAYDSAELFATRALDLSRQTFYRPGKAASLFILGQCALAENQYIVSVRHYFGALNEFEMLSDTNGMAITNFQIGKIYSTAELHAKAIEYFTVAERLSAAGTHGVHQPELLEAKANSYFVLGQYDKASDAYHDLRILLNDKKDDDRLTVMTNRLILCYLYQGRYDAALTANRELLDFFRAVGNRRQ